MRFRWDGDLKISLGAFAAGFLGSYMVLTGAGFSSSPVIGAAAGAYLGICAWVLMFIVENVREWGKE